MMTLILVAAIFVQSVEFVKACRTAYRWYKQGVYARWYRKVSQLIVQLIQRLKKH